MAPDQDAGCLTCRKRQVRCDGTKPTCTRCPKDGLDCRGYKGQLRIVQVNPTKPSKTVRQKPKMAPKERESLVRDFFPLAKHIFVSDRDLWTLIDCANYWNANVIPSTFPAERPFFRSTLMGDEIMAQPIPKICLHIVIVAFRSTQAAKLLMDPLSQPDLCYYRGLALRELPKHLKDAATDTRGTALMSTVMLLTSDLLTTEGHWQAHLEASRRIVALRGGIKQCISDLPDSNFVLVQLFVIDTLTSTTCDSALLPADSLALTDIPNVDFQLIACATTCPAEIFGFIASTSTLRRRQRDLSGSPDLFEWTSILAKVDELLQSLEAFDCTAWAVKMSHLGLLYPIIESNVAPCSSTDGLASVAECFRSAAQLYLLLSCCTSDDGDVMERVQIANKTLHRALNSLFDVASQDWNGPLDTQLWKFATWPLVIACYAWVGFDIAGHNVDLETLFDRSDMIAGTKATQPKSNARQYMKKIQAWRAECPRLQWTWDKGFPERRAMVL